MVYKNSWLFSLFLLKPSIRPLHVDELDEIVIVMVIEVRALIGKPVKIHL